MSAPALATPIMPTRATARPVTWVRQPQPLDFLAGCGLSLAVKGIWHIVNAAIQSPRDGVISLVEIGRMGECSRWFAQRAIAELCAAGKLLAEKLPGARTRYRLPFEYRGPALVSPSLVPANPSARPDGRPSARPDGSQRHGLRNRYNHRETTTEAPPPAETVPPADSGKPVVAVVKPDNSVEELAGEVADALRDRGLTPVRKVLLAKLRGKTREQTTAAIRHFDRSRERTPADVGLFIWLLQNQPQQERQAWTCAHCGHNRLNAYGTCGACCQRPGSLNAG